MTYYGGKELADSFRTVRKNTLIIAEEIPEAQFDFRAAPEVRSVAEMLSHIAVSASRNYELHTVTRLTTFEGFDWGAFTEKRKQEEQRLRTKPQILEALRQEGETWAGRLQGLPEDVLSADVHLSPQASPSSKSPFRPAALCQGARDAPPNAIDAHPAASRHGASPHARAGADATPFRPRSDEVGRHSDSYTAISARCCNT